MKKSYSHSDIGIMSNIVKYALDKLGLTQEELALKLNVSRELINKTSRNRLPVTLGTFAKVQDYLVENGVEKFSQNLLLEEPNLVYMNERLKKKNTFSQYLAPLIPVYARAGYAASYEHTDFMSRLDKYSLPPGIQSNGANWAWFEVEGHSMKGLVNDKDIVLASQIMQEDWNDRKDFYVYIIVTATEVLIKQVWFHKSDKWILVSANYENYPPVEIEVKDVKQLWVERRIICKPRVHKAIIDKKQILKDLT